MASRDDDANRDLNEAKGDCQAEEGAGNGEKGELCKDLDQGVPKGNFSASVHLILSPILGVPKLSLYSKQSLCALLVLDQQRPEQGGK